MFPATLGFTCKQLKHIFCKDDLIIPGLRLHNKEEFLFHQGRSKRSHCAHVSALSRSLQSRSPAKGPSLTTNHSSTSVANCARGCDRNYKMKMIKHPTSVKNTKPKAQVLKCHSGSSCSAWRFSSLGSPGGKPHLRLPRTVLPLHREGVWKCESWLSHPGLTYIQHTCSLLCGSTEIPLEVSAYFERSQALQNICKIGEQSLLQAHHLHWPGKVNW